MVVSIKEATENAIQFAHTVLGSERTTSLQLEEIESTPAGDAWLITLSMVSADPGNAIAAAMGMAKREHKTFAVLKQHGEVKSMKIRELADASCRGFDAETPCKGCAGRYEPLGSLLGRSRQQAADPRLQAYSGIHNRRFQIVARLIVWFGKLLTTPHVLSRVSDLTVLRAKELHAIQQLFRSTVEQIEEVYHPSA